MIRRAFRLPLSLPLSSNAQLALTMGVALGLRLLWLAYTDFTYEDAHITFRFARNIAAGQGFVYNAGDPIYGTTTPLMTLLLSGWMMIFPDAVITGARLIDLLSAMGALSLIWSILDRIGITDARRFVAVMLLVLSDKLWIKDTGGMETPLVIFLMMAVWYAAIRGWHIRAGVLAGLLLLARIDAIVWLVTLMIVFWSIARRPPLRSTLAAGLVYLPWFLFATFYFGSPVPYTITAKVLSYQIGLPPIEDRLLMVFKWMAPVTLPREWDAGSVVVAGVSIYLAVWGVWRARSIKATWPLPLFGVFYLAYLAFSGATFANRYFVPVLWIVLILMGLGLGSIWDRLLTQRSWPASSRAVRGDADGEQQRYARLSALRRFGVGLGALACCAGLWLGYQQADQMRDVQTYNNGTLKEIGLWLNRNSPPDATVLLEPLGYAGFYSDRLMIDVVGLVSPRIVFERERGRNDWCSLIEATRPHYVIAHCDDALGWLDRREESCAFFGSAYERAITFNPLAFDPVTGNPPRSLARAACYEIWGSAER